MPDVSVIIPTYREHDNLVELLPAVFRVVERSGKSVEVIVVDDNSNDGTVEFCRTLAIARPLRLVVRRDERGLATAVVHGLREAAGDVCVVMDADFSHPPESIPNLISTLDGGDHEMAIGSRYVGGGEIDPNWSQFRRLNSRIATLLARGLTSVSDPMAGFFAIRRAAFARAGTLRPLGYKIALELIVRCNCRSVAEVPIHFQDRAAGESKMNAQQQWLYLRHLARLYAVKFLTRRPEMPVPIATDDRPLRAA